MRICKFWQSVLLVALSAGLLLHPPSARSGNELKVWMSAVYSASNESLDVTIELDEFSQPEELAFDLLDNDTNQVMATFTANRDGGRKQRFDVELTENTNIACTVRLQSSVALKNNIRKVEDRPEHCAPYGLFAPLTGQASWGSGEEEVLAGAVVQAELEDFRFTTTADEDGNFDLFLRGLDPDTLVTLVAEGELENDEGATSNVTLESFAGTLGELASEGEDVASLSNSPTWLDRLAAIGRLFIAKAFAQISDAIEVTLNHVTTALIAIIEATGEEPTPETMADLILEKDPQEILAVAAIVSMVADPNTVIELDGGEIPTVEEILADPTIVEDVQDVIDSDPTGELAAQQTTAIEETLDDPDAFPSQTLTETDILGENFEVRLGNISPQDPAGIVHFNADYTGYREDEWGVHTFTWALVGEDLTITYDSPWSSNFLATVPPGASGAALLLSSSYSQLASANGARSFRIQHDWEYPNPADGSGTDVDQSYYVRRSGLPDIASTLGIDTTNQSYNMAIGGDFIGDGVIGGPPSPRLQSTVIHFIADGTGTVANGGVMPADASMTWDATTDPKELSVTPGTSPSQDLDFYVFGAYDSTFQGLARTERGGAIRVSPIVMAPVDSAGFMAGLEFGRYMRINGSYDSNSPDVVLQFDADGNGREEYYRDGIESGVCTNIQPFQWELYPTNELALHYYATLPFDSSRVANCPPSLEGITCFEFRTRGQHLLHENGDNRVIRDYQSIQSIDGSMLVHPIAGTALFEKLSLGNTEPCGITFPDAPPSPFEGIYDVYDFSASGFPFITDGGGLVVDAEGLVTWDVTIGTSPIHLEGHLDSAGRIVWNDPMAPLAVGLNFAIEFSGEGNVKVVIDDFGFTGSGLHFGYGAAQSLPSFQHTAAAVGPWEIVTNLLTVDSQDNVFWDFTVGGFPVQLSGQLSSGEIVWPDPFSPTLTGYNVSIRFNEPGHFVIDIDSDPYANGGSQCSLGYIIGSMPSDYMGSYEHTNATVGSWDVNTSCLTVDGADNVVWNFAVGTFPAGLSGELIDGEIEWLNAFSPQLEDVDIAIRFSEPDHFVLEIDDNPAETPLPDVGPRYSFGFVIGSETFAYMGSYTVDGTDMGMALNIPTTRLTIDSAGNLIWEFDTPLGILGGSGLVNETGFLHLDDPTGFGLDYNITFTQPQHLLIEVIDVDYEGDFGTTYSFGWLETVDPSPHRGHYQVENFPIGADVLQTTFFLVDSAGEVTWDFTVPGFGDQSLTSVYLDGSGYTEWLDPTSSGFDFRVQFSQEDPQHFIAENESAVWGLGQGFGYPVGEIPSPYRGFYTVTDMPAFASVVETASFVVNSAGWIDWTSSFTSGPDTFDTSQSGHLDPATGQIVFEPIFGHTTTVRFGSNEHFLAEMVSGDAEPGSVPGLGFGTKLGTLVVPVNTFWGLYSAADMPVGPAVVSTDYIVVDTGGHVRWSVDIVDYGTDLAEGSLDASGVMSTYFSPFPAASYDASFIDTGTPPLTCSLMVDAGGFGTGSGSCTRTGP